MENKTEFFFIIAFTWCALLFVWKKKILTKTFIFFQTEVNYENVKELPYFDMVFDEVCRLYPTASL